MPCAVVRRAFFIGEKRRRPHHIYLMCSKRRMTHGNGRIVCSTGKARRRCGDGGAIKAEVGKLNVESKERREAKEKTARQEIEMTQSVWVKIRNRIYL